MSVRQGSNIIAGIGTNSISNAHNLLDFKPADRLLNDVSWLRADTFSWQNGEVYKGAYQHLVADLESVPVVPTETYYAWKNYNNVKLYTKTTSPTTSTQLYEKSGGAFVVSTATIDYTDSSKIYVTYRGELEVDFSRDASSDESFGNAYTETIAGITIEYYTAQDGHKIVLPSQETAVEQIYQATGIAWYYIIDTTNQRFKLPRRIHREIVETYESGTNGYRIWSDGYCEQWGQISWSGAWTTITLVKTFSNTDYQVFCGGYRSDSSPYQAMFNTKDWTVSTFNIWSSDDTTSNPAVCRWCARGYLAEGQYPKNSLQDYKYLYFYVGEYSRSAIEQTAGLNAELFNSKADKSEVWTPSSSTSAQKEMIVGWGMPSEEYINITTNPYTAPADGYVYLQTNITKHGSVILQNQTTGIKTYEHGSYEVSVNGFGYIPVRKGDVVSHANNTGYGYSVTVFRFHFAEGEK